MKKMYLIIFFSHCLATTSLQGNKLQGNASGAVFPQ
jgi:hypothetical protein